MEPGTEYMVAMVTRVAAAVVLTQPLQGEGTGLRIFQVTLGPMLRSRVLNIFHSRSGQVQDNEPRRKLLQKRRG